ncbi:AsmA family protein [Desulfobacterales bacterium HSG16]|nr:AsmA family protein [Desulfobacterales bacterium HSG16]
MIIMIKLFIKYFMIVIAITISIAPFGMGQSEDPGADTPGNVGLHMDMNIEDSGIHISADVTGLIGLFSSNGYMNLGRPRIDLIIEVKDSNKKIRRFEIAAYVDMDHPVKIDFTEQSIHIRKLIIEAGTKHQKADSDLTWESDLRINPVTSDFKINDFKLNFFGMKVTGTLAGTSEDRQSGKKHAKNRQKISALVRIGECSPKTILANMGIKIAPETSKDMLKKFSVAFKADYSDKTILISHFAGMLDNIMFLGSAKIKDIKNPEISFDLAVDDINLDSYRSIKIDQKKSRQNKKTDPVEEKKVPGKTIRWKKAIDLIKNMSDIKGNIKIGRLIVFRTRFEDAEITARIKKGKLVADPVKAKFYGGIMTGRFTADARKKPAALLKLYLDIKNLFMERLLYDIFKKKEDMFSGKTKLNLALTGMGNSWRELKQNLSGQCSFSISDGVIHGLKIIPAQNEKEYAFNTQSHDIKSENKQENILKKQEFQSIEARLQIKNGVIHNEDLAFKANDVDIKGKGMINLVEKKVDYELLANITGFPDVPISISGPFSKIQLDIQKMKFAQDTAFGLITSPITLSTSAFNIGTTTIKSIGKGFLILLGGKKETQ